LALVKFSVATLSDRSCPPMARPIKKKRVIKIQTSIRFATITPSPRVLDKQLIS
jgi:hypothetical protein